MKFNVCFEDGKATSIKHVNHNAAPPKAAKWWFRMDGSTAYLHRETAGTRRVEKSYAEAVEQNIAELPFVQAVEMNNEE
jgi:hypothetical protein